MSTLRIESVGPQVLVQDAGRPGLAELGVGHSGAADRSAYELGGRLVAHGEGRACLEVTLGGLTLTAEGPMTIALTGADAQATIDGQPVPHAAPLAVRDGQQVRLGMPSAGLRTYVSVRGGLEVAPVLGSRSRDTLAGLGPEPVTAGQRLAVGDYDGPFPNVDVAPVPLPAAGRVVLRASAGPRYDWFSAPEMLERESWTVSDRSDRVGVRLTGESLERLSQRQGEELPSEGMVRGCIQVPPDGQPVLFLSDHPVTGGYPVIGVLTRADADAAAQLRPGQQVTLRWSQAS